MGVKVVVVVYTSDVALGVLIGPVVGGGEIGHVCGESALHFGFSSGTDQINTTYPIATPGNDANDGFHAPNNDAEGCKGPTKR